MMAGGVVGAGSVGGWWSVRRRSRWSVACVAQRELQRARWCCGACATSRSATSNTFLGDLTSHWFQHGQCIYTLYVQYFLSIITRRRRVDPSFPRSELFHYGISTFPSQCQRHLKAATHLQMAFVRKAPFPANHVAVARSSVMALTLSARDVLRVAIKVVFTSCKNDVCYSADFIIRSDKSVTERHPSLTPKS